MNKHSMYLFLLSAISLNAQAIETDREPTSDRFASCFADDSSESLCWQQMLTESNPAVRYDFGAHYANGDGVKQDFAKGRYWMHQAALKGFPLAQYNLGVMFVDGLGGIQSKDCAVHWLNKSASESDETREMAQQALAALSELTVSAGMPKVYRILTVEECEQLPEVSFPGGEIELAQVEDTPDSQPDTDEADQLQHAPVELDVLATDLPAEPNQAVHSLPIEPEPKSPPLTVFRERMGQFFIQLGYQLLGQTLNSEQDAVHHNVNDKPGLNTPRPVAHADEGTIIETANVEPEPVIAETVISAPTEVVLSLDKPLFVEPILDDPLDVRVISPDNVEAEIPLEATDPTVKPSEAEKPEVALASPANEAGKLASPKREEATLPVLFPAAPNIAPGGAEKAVSRTLNLGGVLRSAPKEHYTLQLGSASQAEPLQVLAKKHKLSNYLVYETERHGRRWYVLVSGEYAGIAQAKQALQQLPGALKKDRPWIRSLAHVHTEL